MDSIAETLDIEPKEISTVLADHIEVVIPEDDKTSDRKTARDNLYKMLSTGETVLGQSMAMLQEVPTPRSVEVITGLIKTMSELSKDLIELHPPEMKGDEKIINNNVAYMGTVSSLLEDIKNEEV